MVDRGGIVYPNKVEIDKEDKYLNYGEERYEVLNGVKKDTSFEFDNVNIQIDEKGFYDNNGEYFEFNDKGDYFRYSDDYYIDSSGVKYVEKLDTEEFSIQMDDNGFYGEDGQYVEFSGKRNTIAIMMTIILTPMVK